MLKTADIEHVKKKHQTEIETDRKKILPYVGSPLAR